MFLLVLGMDEAGRGPVLGPLVVAGVVAREDEAEELARRLGVRDSKKLSPKKREELAREIRGAARVFVEVIEPGDIDRERERRSLNEIELLLFGRIVEKAASTLPIKKVVFDLPEASTRFASYLERLVPRGVKIVGEHGADDKYPIVSMASIIAKVERDKRVRAIERELGFPLGSGYPHDPVTREALERIVSSGSGMEHVRKSWETFKRMAPREKQRGLESFS